MSPSSMARNSMPPNPSRCAASISYRSVSSVCSPSASHQRSSGRYSMGGFLISWTRSSIDMSSPSARQQIRNETYHFSAGGCAGRHSMDPSTRVLRSFDKLRTRIRRPPIAAGSRYRALSLSKGELTVLRRAQDTNTRDR